MSATFMLFVRPTGATDGRELIDDVSKVCGKDFKNSGHDGENEYIAKVTSGPLILDLSFGYDDEGDPTDPFPFGKFPWSFTLFDSRDPYWSQVALQDIHSAYEGLTATGKYECVLVHVETETLIAHNVASQRRS
ncbi:hypothetical protein [Gandjariella thermophila]|uniref:Uncharacterized protein n=1 Tax=Gandjariella thermophila TaxID=1931992 RepID=A0A4D4J8J2_9PSEU|nr:hypothetical protein [Gandjariella thermophila]GDY30287.1 hypothetical protein GTS_19200 [Gandjariella thermophila]